MRTLPHVLRVSILATLLAGCAAPRHPVAAAAEPPAPPAPSPPAPLALPVDAPPAPNEPPPSPPPPPVPQRPRSAQLPSGLYNPMPGGVFAGYQEDTGLDIAGSPRPVYALAAGTLDYSEPGHTLWTGPSDTANSIRFALDTPLVVRGRKVTHVYYAHLSRLETLQHEGATVRRHVEGGELLGVSGVARHSPHLHIGLLLDGEVEQYRGTFLFADEIRQVLGGYRNGERLPRGPGEAVTSAVARRSAPAPRGSDRSAP